MRQFSANSSSTSVMTPRAGVCIALHGLDREAERVEVVLQVAPAHAGLHAGRFRLGIQADEAVHFPHVEVQPADQADLAAHAVAAAADADLAGPVRQRLHDG